MIIIKLDFTAATGALSDLGRLYIFRIISARKFAP